MPCPIALITGASRGIGRACALALGAAREPFDIAVQYKSDAAAAESLVQELHRHGRRAQSFQADLTQPGAAAALADAVAKQFGPPRALIHAAGFLLEQPVAFTRLQDWDALMEIHALAAAALARACLSASADARIVFIGSVAGSIGLGNAAAYAAAKGALHGLCKSLVLEAAASGGTVNVVAPGFVETDLTRAQDETRRAECLKKIPAGRYATPEEAAALAAFLCSPPAACITGQIVAIDGGLSLR